MSTHANPPASPPEPNNLHGSPRSTKRSPARTRPRKPRRAELEAALRASESRYRALVDDLTDLVCWFDPDGTLTDANEPYGRFVGKTRSEMIGRPWLSQVAAVDLPRVAAALQSLTPQDPALAVECQVLAACGLACPVRFVLRGLFSASGELVLVQGVGRELTGQEHVFKQRDDLTRHRRVALDAAQLGWWHCDIRTGITSGDERSRQMLSLAGRELAWDELLAQVHPDDRCGVQEAVAAALDRANAQPCSAKFRVHRPGGTLRWLQAHGSATFEGLGANRRAVSLEGTLEDITERKQVQADLRRWADAFEHCAHGIALGLPGTNRILACNPAYARMLGRSNADVVGRPILGLYAPEEGERIKSTIAAADRNGQSRTESRMVRADGSTFPVQLDLVSVRDRQGHPLYRVATVQDITQRKRAEAVVLEQSRLQDQLATIAATVPGIIYSFRLRPDGSACLPFATPIVEELWGLRPEDVRDDFAEGFARIHAADVARVRDSIVESAQALTPWRNVFRIQHPLKGERWVEGHSMPRREDDGSVLWHGFMHDVTERKQVEEELREREERLRSLGDNIPSGAIYQLVSPVDGPNHYTYLSAGIARIFGIEAQSILANPKPFWDLIEEEDRPRLQAAEAQSARDLTLFDCEFRQRTATGEVRWIHARSTPHRLADGSTVWEGVALDVTGRKQIEDEREVMMHLLRLLNGPSDLQELVREVTAMLRERFEFEAIGVRLLDGVDYPYFESCGFPPEFIRRENHLCKRDAHGRLERDAHGRAILECMCGNVLEQRFDPKQPFFTARGSFWSNDTTQLLATTTPAARQASTRNRCNTAGYESVALVALRVGDTTFGLLQFNDRRKERFTPRTMALLERIADSLAIAIAHRQSALRLAESEQQFRAMFEVASIGMAQADVHTGQWRRVNQKLCEITGYTEAEMLRMQVPEITHPDDRPRDWEAFQRVVRGEVPDYRMEKRYLRKGGETVWVNVNMTIIRDAGGQPVRTLATIEDVTARKVAEEALRRSHERLQKVLEVETVGVMFWDLTTGHLVDANSTFLNLMGYTREDVEARRLTWRQLTPPEYIAESEAEIRKFQVTGRVGPYEKEYLRKDGTRRWLVFAGSSLGENACVEFCVDISDRKRAEAALRNREYELRSVLNTNPNIIFVKNRESRILLANEALGRFYSLTVDELVGTLQTELQARLAMPAEEIACWRADDLAAIDTGIPQHVEERSTWKDGSVHWYHTTKVRIDLPGGEAGVLVVSQDITARKQAEQALADEASRRRILVDQSSDGIVVIDEQGAVCEANRRYAEMLGYTPEEVLRLHVWDWDTQWDRAQLLQMIQEVGENGSRFETRHRRKDGTLFDVEISNNGATIAGRKLVFCVCRDISQRKLAEEQLRKLSRAVEQSPASIVITDPQGCIEYVNPRFVEITGYSFEEARGKNPRVLKSGELASDFYAELWRTIKAGGEWRGEFHNRRKDGSFFWESAVISAIKDDTGKLTHFIAVKEDITARKLAEEALRKSENLLREMGRLAKAGGWELDVASGQGHWTEEIARIHDLEPDTPASKELSLACYPPETRTQIAAAVERAITHGVPYDLELEFVSAKGNPKWVHTIGQPVQEGGRVIKLRGTLQDITERKQAEAELRTSQELYHSLVEQLGHPLFRLDRDGRLTFANSQYCRAMGRSLAELVGRTDFDLFPADLAAKYWADSCHVMETGQAFESLERHLAPDGGESYVRVAKTALHDSQGRIVGLQCLFWDVTSQHLAEQALRESEQRFLAAFQSSPAPAVITSLHGQDIREVNAAFCQLTGFSREDLLGNTCLDCGLWAQPSERAEMMRRFDAEGRVRGLEIGLRTSSGELRVLLYSVESLQLAGEPCLIASGVDITERKQAEAALRQLNRELEERVAVRTKELAESEQRHRDLVETIPDWVWEVDAQGRCIFCGPQCRDLLGFEPEEILGQTPFVFMPPDEAARVAPLAESLMAQGKTLRALENVNQRKDGSLVVLETHGVPVYDDAGCLLGYRGVNRDITERRRAAEELRLAKEKADAANRAKSVFLANMSHEIRTPMNAVLGFTQLLLGDVSANPEQRQYLTRIMRSGEHLLEIINEILEMARIESGRSLMHPLAFDLPEMLQDLETMFHLRAQPQQIDFAVEPAGDLPRILIGDPTKLRQIFINLLSNAFKFTPAGGRITLRVRAEPESAGSVRLRAEVADSGPGILPEDLACVFEPFYQTLSGRAAGGTGLGLSISREIARLMGGDLTARSEFGSGSVFELEILLPLAEAGRLPGHRLRPRMAKLTSRSAGYRVLVADDAQDNREVLTRFLSALEFQVRAAENGLEALELSRSWNPGLVILDLRMPVMDGFEACREIRKAHGSSIKILILSASVSDEDRRRASAAGANAFIAKPFEHADLLECIREQAGVEYVTSAPPPPAGGEPSREELELSLTNAVHRLPAGLLNALRKALLAADYYEMLALMAQVSPLDGTLASQLRSLIEHLDYGALNRLLRRTD